MFRLPHENEGMMDRSWNLALKWTTYSQIDLLGTGTCKEQDIFHTFTYVTSEWLCVPVIRIRQLEDAHLERLYPTAEKQGEVGHVHVPITLCLGVIKFNTRRQIE